ncbi:hypothetical protein [Sphingobacterium sp.]|uniref:hypothetical protein n=1 Tax=Sphingobacterium sp. TaxID=341027 RepID=UPI0031D32E12
MSYKILASIRFIKLEGLDLIETPIFNITTHDTVKAKMLDISFKKFAGWRDLSSYDKNALAYAVFESIDDNEAFQQLMNEELTQRAGQMETFLLFLWFIRDNSISLEQAYGYFTVARSVNWWTGRNVFSTCTGQFEKTAFNEVELREATDLLLNYTEHCVANESKSQQVNLATKEKMQKVEFQSGMNPNKVENRIERAMSFLSSARSTPHLPQKITHYMAILECLFSTDGNEIIHKVSERTAFYLEKDTTERIAIYKAVKNAYNIRSKFVHGDKPTRTHEQLCIIATEVDIIIRRVLKKIILNDHIIFLQKDMNLFFEELIFKSF